MMIDIQRDLTAILSDKDFGEIAITPVGEVSGILDDAQFESETEYGREVIRTKATFMTKTSHGLTENDVIEVAGKIYTIRNSIDDGQGLTTYQLEKN